jgi:uncharacterized protein (TIGR03435 family)
MIRAGLLVFTCSVVFGQTTENLTFEVASVKPSAPVSPGDRVYFGPARGGPGTPDPGQITWTYARMKDLLMTAYDAKAYQISGPDWINRERYDVADKVPANATRAQVSVMWQNLLAERFGLTVHHESREFAVEELVIGKGGSKLKDTVEDLTALPSPGPPQIKKGELVSPGAVVTIYPTGMAHTMARAQPISYLTANLSSQLNHPVLDKTGLTGKYDFSLDFKLTGFQLPPGAASPPGGGGDEPGPDMGAAVQQQLGLRLVPGRANIDVVIVDKVEKVPTAN